MKSKGGLSKTARASLAEGRGPAGLPPGAYHVEVVRGECPRCGGRFRMGVAPSDKEAAICRACFDGGPR